MKLRFGTKLISLLFAVTFISSLVGYVMGARATHKKDAPEISGTSHPLPIPHNEILKEENDDFASVTVTESIVTKSYVLRDNNGSLALYTKHSDGSETLYQSYDISVNFLPKSDRELLKEGIETDVLSDALQLIEDYSS